MEGNIIGQFRCSQAECEVETTGICVNGLPIDKCQQRIPLIRQEGADEEHDDDREDSPDPDASSNTIRLWWGDSLSEQQVENITYRFPSKLVLVIGEPSYGKSTLFAALFDSFHQEGCGDYHYKGTRTPIAFERICHLAREKSKGRSSKTERTKSYEFVYLHLCVKRRSGAGEVSHLLFADVNGERYQHARDSDEEMKKLSVFHRADKIFIIADGKELADNSERHVVRRDVTKMIERCIKNNMLDGKSITILITKWDEVSSLGKKEEVTKFFSEYVSERYSEVVDDIILVASRSMNKEVPARSGLNEFLSKCLESKAPTEQVLPSLINREYQKYKFGKDESR